MDSLLTPTELADVVTSGLYKYSPIAQAQDTKTRKYIKAWGDEPCLVCDHYGESFDFNKFIKKRECDKCWGELGTKETITN